MKTYALVAVIGLSATLAACGKQADVPATTTGPVAPASTSTASALPAPADRQTSPAATPATHAEAPQPGAVGSTTASTARDTPASGPNKDLTAAEESRSMPKPGQTDNHFTPSIDGAAKGTQQSPGSTTTAPPSAAPTPPK